MRRLTDEQWDGIYHYFPEENRPKGQRGILRYLPGGSPEAVLWILKTGAQWHLQPQCYSNYKTVQRRFQT